MLADRFGAPRAAWIARTLTPANLAQRSLTVPPVFPTLPPVAPGGEDVWRTAPQARLMPDRWTAIVHSGGHAALQVTGRDVTRPLAVGPDPQRPPLDAATEAEIAAGDALAVDPGMNWMIDFDEAESKGMALRIAIPPSILAAGLDSLVVFGVGSSVTATSAGAQFADLLDAHHYPSAPAAPFRFSDAAANRTACCRLRRSTCGHPTPTMPTPRGAPGSKACSSTCASRFGVPSPAASHVSVDARLHSPTPISPR
jgi:hypothetical protein